MDGRLFTGSLAHILDEILHLRPPLGELSDVAIKRGHRSFVEAKVGACFGGASVSFQAGGEFDETGGHPFYNVRSKVRRLAVGSPFTLLAVLAQLLRELQLEGIHLLTVRL